MKQTDIDALKNTVHEVARTGNTALLAQTPTAHLVGALIEHHEATVRSEAFWGSRAPAMNQELLALRPLEKFARLIANGGTLSTAQRVELARALDALDTTRGGPRAPHPGREAQTITAADVGNVADVLAPKKDGKSRKGNREKA